MVGCLYFINQNDAVEYDPSGFMDALVDSGFASSDGEARGFAESMIVVTTDVNAHFSRDVVSQLVLLNRSSNSEPIDLSKRAIVIGATKQLKITTGKHLSHAGKAIL